MCKYTISISWLRISRSDPKNSARIPLFIAFLNTASMKKIGEVNGATCSRQNFTSIGASLRRIGISRSDRVVNQDVDSWTPPYSGYIYIYKANITSLYQTCTIRSTVRCFNGRRSPIPLFWSIAIKSDVFFFDNVAPSQISRHRDSCKPL